MSEGRGDTSSKTSPCWRCSNQNAVRAIPVNTGPVVVRGPEMWVMTAATVERIEIEAGTNQHSCKKRTHPGSNLAMVSQLLVNGGI